MMSFVAARASCLRRNTQHRSSEHPALVCPRTHHTRIRGRIVECSALQDGRTLPASVSDSVPEAATDSAPPKPCRPQPFDYSALLASSASVSSSAVPSRLETAVQTSSSQLLLGLRTQQRGRKWLVLDWHAVHGHIALSHSPPPQPFREDVAYSLSSVLRATAKGLAILKVAPAAPFERIVQIDLGLRPGDDPTISIFLELFGGGRSNLVVVQNDGKTILACGRQVSGKKATRSLQTGNVYSPPPTPNGATPKKTEAFADWSTRLGDLGAHVTCASALVRTYQGVGPALARSLLLLVPSVTEQTTFVEMDENSRNQLYTVWQRWCDYLEAPLQFCHPKITPTGYTLIGPVQESGSSEPSKFISRYYGALRDEEEFSRISQSVESQIGTLLTKADNRVSYFQEKLVDSSGAEKLVERADQILAFAHTWSPDSPFVLHEELETGARCRIPIPENSTAVEFATALHRKSRKLKRSATTVQELLDASKGEVTLLQQANLALTDVCQGDRNLVVLKEIQTEVADLKEREKLGARPGQVSKPRPKVAGSNARNAAKAERRKNQGRREGTDPTAGLLRIPVPGKTNAVVLVGRNNIQNDRVTFEVATTRDWWLHAAGVAGAHVVLRGVPEASGSHENGGEICEELQFAADVAARCSRAKESTEVAINYLRPKNINRAGPPGMVTFRNEKTIFGRPERVAEAVSNARAK